MKNKFLCSCWICIFHHAIVFLSTFLCYFTHAVTESVYFILVFFFNITTTLCSLWLGLIVSIPRIQGCISWHNFKCVPCNTISMCPFCGPCYTTSIFPFFCGSCDMELNIKMAFVVFFCDNLVFRVTASVWYFHRSRNKYFHPRLCFPLSLPFP